MEMSRKDPHAYLSRMGVTSGMSKVGEQNHKAMMANKVAVREHQRQMPMKKPNIEGNESAMYEKLEKRSLRSLKGGGTEKELREGHNEKKWIAGAIKHPGALHKQLGVKQGEKIPAKKMAAAKAGKYGEKAEKRANLAKTLKSFRKK